METYLAYIGKVSSNGWLTTRFDSVLEWPLPEYLRVYVESETEERESFEVLEGKLRGRKARMRKKGWRSNDWDGFYFEANDETAIEQLLLSYQSNTKSQFARDAIQSADRLFRRSNKNKRYVAHAANASELKHIEQCYQQAQEARALTYSGVSKLPLQIGGLVSISKDKVESLFLVTKVTHQSNLFGHYECQFDSIPSDVKVPHYTDPFQTKSGESQPAKVTANNDPKGMGRVIVEFHWGYKTDWIRMVRPHGGNGKGFYFIPEVGEEVLVGFEGGECGKTVHPRHQIQR